MNLENADQLSKMVAGLTAMRADTGKTDEPFDIIAALPPDTDPVPYAAAGATWWLVEFPSDSSSVDQVRGVIRDGPMRSS